MERPKPTKQLLIEICGANQGLISSLHHGLSEVPMGDFYPVLDLDELIAFSASSWKSREKDPESFSELVKNSPDAYTIFNEVYRIGFPWLNKYKQISPELETKYKKLNPFQGADLRDRLETIDPEFVEKMKERLSETVCEYVFDCQYHQRKMERGGDNYRLEVMHFQPVYPKKGVIVPNFASEIARIISRYPGEYFFLEQFPEEDVKSELTKEAQDLFPGLEPDEAYETLLPDK